MANKQDILSPAPHKDVLTADVTDTNHIHVIYYFDKKYKPIEKKKAKIGILHEYDDHGRSIRREYIQLQDGEVIEEAETTFTDAEILAELELLKEKRLARPTKDKERRKTTSAQKPRTRKPGAKKEDSEKTTARPKAKSGASRRPAQNKNRNAKDATAKKQAGSNNCLNNEQGAQGNRKRSSSATATPGIRRRPNRSGKLPGMTNANMPKSE